MVLVVLALALLLHLAFMLGEMFPWHQPKILAGKLKKDGIELDDRQQRLVATIVRNAGIYNFILVAGFFWSCFPSLFGPIDESAVKMIRTFFFSGAVVAGLFGLTLSRFTAIQAGVGLAGLIAVHWPASE